MERKGQAAMEFLMTYGWAILAAIIAIAVLWFLIGNPASLVGNKFTISDPLVAEGMALSQAGIQLEIRNGDSEQIIVSNIEITDVSGCGAPSYAGGDTTITSGEVETVTIAGCAGLTTGNNFRGTIKVTYTRGSSNLVQVASGRVSGKVA